MDKKRAYQISVKGQLGNRMWDWLDEMSIKVSHCEDFGTITMMTGIVEDQALLHGILYQLYSMGYVLISVNCLAKKEWEVYGLKIVTPPAEQVKE